jgi:hypothetical protein
MTHISPSIEKIRPKDGAARAPQEKCLRKASRPAIGMATSCVVTYQVIDT